MTRLPNAMVQDLNTDFRSDVRSVCGDFFQDLPGLDEDEFRAILHSRSGGAHHSHTEHVRDAISRSTDPNKEVIQSDASLIFVSPRDGEPYICFAAARAERSYQSIDNTEPSEIRSLPGLTTMLVLVSDDLAHLDEMGPAIVLPYFFRQVDKIWTGSTL